MARLERVHEILTSPLTEEHIQEKVKEGWRVVAVEWGREIEGLGEIGKTRKEVPYGLQVSDDCEHLEENSVERGALQLMLDMIVVDRSLSQIAEELNRRGYRTRRGSQWTQTAVFNMLPRLIEAAPEIRRPQPVWPLNKAS